MQCGVCNIEMVEDRSTYTWKCTKCDFTAKDGYEVKHSGQRRDDTTFDAKICGFCHQAHSGLGCMNPECSHYIGPKVGVSEKAPGMKYDGDKPDFTLLPDDVIWGIVDVMMFGMKRYNRDNWQKVEPPRRYLAAMHRHIRAHRKGEILDPDSGLPHLLHMCCDAIMFTWHEIYKGKS